LRGRRFSSDEYLEEVVEEFSEDLSKKKFFEGVALLEKRWNKCVTVNGSYVEK
jgi:hypothetical protein